MNEENKEVSVTTENITPVNADSAEVNNSSVSNVENSSSTQNISTEIPEVDASTLVIPEEKKEVAFEDSSSTNTSVSTQANVETNNNTSATPEVEQEIKLESAVVLNANNESAPMQEITPQNNNIEDEKKKKTNNTIYFVLVILVAVFVYFIDDIIDLFTEDNYYYYNTDGTDKVTSNNLVNGYIQIGVNNSFIKMLKVKFYNFKLNNDNKVTFNFISDNTLNSSDDLGIYLLIYDGSGNLLHKELFNVDEKIDKDTVKQYQMSIDADLYKTAHFAKVVTYTEKEASETSVITCTFEDEDKTVKLKYNVIYNFVNNDLKNYKVTKELTTTDSSSNEYAKYNATLSAEKVELQNNDIKVSEDENYLSYTIDLTKLSEGYTPDYKLNTLPYIVKTKETEKGWTCK